MYRVPRATKLSRCQRCCNWDKYNKRTRWKQFLRQCLRRCEGVYEMIEKEEGTRTSKLRRWLAESCTPLHWISGSSWAAVWFIWATVRTGHFTRTYWALQDLMLNLHPRDSRRMPWWIGMFQASWTSTLIETMHGRRMTTIRRAAHRSDSSR